MEKSYRVVQVECLLDDVAYWQKSAADWRQRATYWRKAESDTRTGTMRRCYMLAQWADNRVLNAQSKINSLGA